MTAGVTTFTSFENFRMPEDLKEHFSCSFQNEVVNLARKFFHLMSFCSLQFSLKQFYYAFPEKYVTFLWARLRERTLAIAEKRLEHIEIRDIFCVHR